MPADAAGGQSRVSALLAIVFALGVSVFFGLAVGKGLTGLAMYAMILVSVMSVMLIWPDLGLLGVAIIYCITPYIPKSGYTTEAHVTGLNALNLTFVGLFSAWILAAVVKRKKFRLWGTYGKLILAYMAIIIIGTMRPLFDIWLNYGDYSVFLKALPEFRIMLIIPLTTFFLLQSESNRKHLIFLVSAFVSVFLIAFSWKTHSILSYDETIGGLRHILMESGGTLTLFIVFFPIAIAMLMTLKSHIWKAFWIMATMLAWYPFVYQQGRAVYLSAFIAVGATVVLLSRGNTQNKAIGFVILITLGVIVAAAAPLIIYRFTFSFFDPSGTQRIDPSLNIRFVIWEGILNEVIKRPWLFFFGGGIGTENAVSRMYIGQGLGSHNTWLAAMLRYGIAYHIVMIWIFIKQFAILKATALSHESTYIRGFAAGLAGSLIGYQIHIMGHSVYVVGQHEMMLWSVVAILMTQMAPGGQLANIRLPDGRAAQQLVGYGPPQSEQKEPDDSVPVTMSKRNPSSRIHPPMKRTV